MEIGSSNECQQRASRSTELQFPPSITSISRSLFANFRALAKSFSSVVFLVRLSRQFRLTGRKATWRSEFPLFTISSDNPAKIFRNYAYYASVSTINQSKSLPGFRVAVASLDGINGWSIQTLLRGENDSKQSGEIQATFIDCFNCLHTERSP